MVRRLNQLNGNVFHSVDDSRGSLPPYSPSVQDDNVANVRPSPIHDERHSPTREQVTPPSQRGMRAEGEADNYVDDPPISIPYAEAETSGEEDHTVPPPSYEDDAAGRPPVYNHPPEKAGYPLNPSAASSRTSDNARTTPPTSSSSSSRKSGNFHLTARNITLTSAADPSISRVQAPFLQPHVLPSFALFPSASSNIRRWRDSQNPILTASLRKRNGAWVSSSLDLNACLANDDGKFAWRKAGNFGRSARKLRVVDVDGRKILRAELRSCKGDWDEAEVCLSDRVENVDGRFTVLC